MMQSQLFLQLLFVLCSLFIVGEPLRFVITRYARCLTNLNLIKIIVLNFYLGALFFYAIALVPVGLFRAPVLYAFSLAALIISILVHRHDIAQRIYKVNLFSIRNLVTSKQFTEGTIIISLAVILYLLSAFPLSNFVLGSIHDTSQNALSTQILLEHGYLASTFSPYLPADITVPQGHVVLFGYTALLNGWDAAQAVFYLTPLFNFLAVLGAYFFGEELLAGKRLGLIFSFLISIISMYPLLITWGGNSFLAGLPLFFVCAGLLFSVFRNNSSQKITQLVIYGVLAGFLAAIHITFYFVLMLGLVFLTLLSARNRQLFKSHFRIFVAVILSSLLPFVLFLYRFVSVFFLPAHNVGIPDFISNNYLLYPGLIPVYPEGQSNLLIFSDPFAISPYPVIRAIWLGLILASAITIVFLLSRKQKIVSNTLPVALLLLSAYCLSALIYNGFLNHLPFIIGRLLITVIDPTHLQTIIYICLTFLIGFFSLELFSRLLKKAQLHKQQKLKGKLLGLGLIFLAFGSIFGGFIYFRFSSDEHRINDLYSLFTPLDDDYRLMVWMKDNLPSNAVILVNPYEAGNFIPSVSQKVVVYPTSDNQLSYPYYELCKLIENRTLNSTTYDLMRFFNVTYVYVGAKATFSWIGNYKWDPTGTLFLGNPNFQLINRIGEAAIYKFDLVNPYVALSESFEDANISRNGWQLISDTRGGDGAGNFSRSSLAAYDGSYGCILFAQKTSRDVFTESIRRVVDVSDSSNVSFSFYLSEDSGFGNGDGLAIVISSIDWQHQLYFATPATSSVGPVNFLPSNSGYFTFNLSDEWEKNTSTLLPRVFYIDVLNIDRDGIQNLLHVDDILVVS